MEIEEKFRCCDIDTELIHWRSQYYQKAIFFCFSSTTIGNVH